MLYSFEEAMKDAQKFIISPGCKTEVRGYVSDCRVDRKTLPEGWHAYDIRHGDDPMHLCTIEDTVVVNHAYTFLTQQEVVLTKVGIHGRPYRNLYGRGGWTFDS